MLEQLQQRLLALHRGGIEKDFSDAGASTPWVTDAVLARVLEEGVVLRPNPQHVLCQIGAALLTLMKLRMKHARLWRRNWAA